MLTTFRSYQALFFKKHNFSYQRKIFEDFNFNDNLIGLLGPRGVGKTTFLIQYLKHSSLDIKKKLYISADMLGDYSLLEVGLEFEKKGGELFIIDEIHKYPNFEKELKNLYDLTQLKIIFSGSSALAIDNKKGDLSRRAVIYTIYGLSFREFLELNNGISLPVYTLDEILQNHIEIAYHLTTLIKPYEYFETYLRYGYYPFYFQNKETYSLKLRETINTVIEVDIPSIFSIEYEYIVKLKKLVNLICNSLPFKINIKALSEKIALKNYQTLYKYLYFLDKASILKTINQKSRGDLIFTKPDKIYLHNTNLHFSYCENYEIGTIREVFFMSMLIHKYNLQIPKHGDFIVNDATFEIGRKNKTKKQIKGVSNSYIVKDDILVGHDNIIPLWIFGFLY